MEQLKRLKLSNIGGKDKDGNSGAEELFAELLDDVLSNIARLDTDATEKREITLKIAIMPSANRDAGAVEIMGSVKLAKLNSAHCKVAFGYIDGEQVASPIEETLPLFEDTPKPLPQKLPPVAGAPATNTPAPPATGTAGQ